MWKFPKGLNLVNFDLEMKPAAAMRCDSATYFSQRRLWRLDGNIVMVNVQRDTFLTEQLYWDQNQCKVYSDSFIHIVRTNHIIEGYGFESNQEMTQYNVNRPTAIIPVDRSEKGGKGQRPFGPGMTAVAQDSLPSRTRLQTPQRLRRYQHNRARRSGGTILGHKNAYANKTLTHRITTHTHGIPASHNKHPLRSSPKQL